MSRLVFVGSVNDDAIAVVPHLPGPDQRLLAEALVHAGGGNSATAAVAAARLGGDVAFVGPIAEDPTGERIVADLTREGVDVSGVVPVPAGAGGASVVLVDRSSGTRAICTRPLPAFELGPRARKLVADAAWVHLDHLGWPAARDVLAVGSRIGPPAPRISVDEGNPIPGFHPRGVHLYGPTLDRLRLTYGDQPVVALLERARADGAGLVVATAGGDGAHLLPTTGGPVHVPGFAVDVVSTLGAGDVFHGALLLAVDRGLDPADAVRYANGAAALACRAIDGRSGIPTHDELTRFLTSAP
ncbi:ribokinase/sulfofructose kinase [Actinopolymorpha cephalotaxi]|uniref:Ribokinase/sulfofructose kinase n=1 Tax=Actinopolymorpha cephalotaxi TaxID=504797 RepID=A0A1I2UPK0_9ACTN|nr:PfkB family carbohydrate kinase [Actinopolymorpha cephalotaxi]NYH86634.1 sugar/nucleoside kinase (ribokinase family) [Actinopolymorpha cephalotaxi]SFG77637.1 ribokinase/sulfofructose kinase [Actinopolymorpha cephalotaxi]